MYPVLGALGSFTLYTYTLLIDLGIVVALAALYFKAPAGRGARWLDLGLAAAVGGLLGARLLYVLANLDYFLLHLEDTVRLWDGGLAWPGAAGGALLAAWLYSRRTGEPLLPAFDALALPIALLGGLGWGGCLAAGCAYGFEVAPGQYPAWLTTNAPDLYGLIAPRFATQALGVAWSLLALLMLWGTQRSAAAGPRRWPAGALGFYALSLVALGAFALAFARGDPMPLAAGYRLDVIGSAVVLLASTLAWGALVLRAAPAAAAVPAPEPPPAGDSPPAGPLANP